MPKFVLIVAFAAAMVALGTRDLQRIYGKGNSDKRVKALIRDLEGAADPSTRARFSGAAEIGRANRKSDEIPSNERRYLGELLDSVSK